MATESTRPIRNIEIEEITDPERYNKIKERNKKRKNGSPSNKHNSP